MGGSLASRVGPTHVVIKVGETGRRNGCCVGVYPLMVFSPLLCSLFHLTGGLMGADLTTGAGTSAGKNGLLFSHMSACRHTNTHLCHPLTHLGP